MVQKAPKAAHKRDADGSILPNMDLLWTPWRYRYVTTAESAVRPGVAKALDGWQGDLGCVFCNMLASVNHAIEGGMPVDEAEKAAGIVTRGAECFICLNAYPYNSGHVMVIPNVHEASLAALPVSTAHELMDLAQKTERVLNALYTPHGINFGMNLGQAAGAGVAGHLHLHALPRWIGDTNFMTTVAETRVMPESLDVTWERMRAGYKGIAG
jgi:ATP adenylyltransferase